jgi:hypothetical protein
MGAQSLVIIGTFDLRKHSPAEAFQRQRMQAPENFPIGFLDVAMHFQLSRPTPFGVLRFEYQHMRVELRDNSGPILIN